jgi:hypothetical protein
MDKSVRLAALISLLSVASLAASVSAQDKIRMGLSSVSGLHSAVWVAETKGLFRKHGIDVEVIVTGQGGTAGISALIANDVQMVNSAGDVLVAAALRGGDTVMVASVVNKGLQRLITKPDIKTPADLKGKRVGVTRIGAVYHSVLLMMLQRWKMSVNDVQVITRLVAEHAGEPRQRRHRRSRGDDSFDVRRRRPRIPSVARHGRYRHLLSAYNGRDNAPIHQEQSRQGAAISQGLRRRNCVREA